MKFISGTPAGIISDAQQIIEIKLWEAYLLNDRHNILQSLNAYSIGHGPVEDVQHAPGRISYRFQAGDWETYIKPMLYDNRIPVVINPAALSARKERRFREPVLVY